MIATLSVISFACWAYGMIDAESAVRCGGYTRDGAVKNGRFYLGSHGRLTEVTQDEWTSRRLHERLANAGWVTGVMCFATAIGLTSVRIRGSR